MSWNLNARRGRIEGMEARASPVGESLVPLVSMFEVTTDLRSSTQGRASSKCTERYEEVPPSLAEEIIHRHI